MIKCAICGKIVERKCRKTSIITCSKNCYMKVYKQNYKQPSKVCKKCKNVSKIQGRGLCYNCYMQSYVYKRELCSVCKKTDIIRSRSENGPICRKCHKNPKQVCSICNCLEQISDRKKCICKKCYVAPKKKCSNCKKITAIYDRKKNTCKKCSNMPLKLCSGCLEFKVINTYTETEALCLYCYKKKRIKEDEQFRLKNVLSSRLRMAFLSHGKLKGAPEDYHINYKNIIEYLGPCPGDRKHWQIDHIIPLSAFNYFNNFEVWASFHPTNHQWLLAEVNNKKRAKYDKNDLNIFLKKVKLEWEMING